MYLRKVFVPSNSSQVISILMSRRALSIVCITQICLKDFQYFQPTLNRPQWQPFPQ